MDVKKIMETNSIINTKLNSETLLGKLIRLPLRLLPKGIPVPIFSNVAKGMIWLTGAHVHGCWLGIYERDKQYFATTLIKPSMTIYDIGANAGFYTLIFSRLVGDSGRVVSFEPDAGNMNLCRQYVTLNSLKNVTLVQSAISLSRGIFGFSTNGGATCRLEDSSAYMMPTLSLDDCVFNENFPLPDVVKMDIEGGEVMALKGAKKLIEKMSVFG